MIDIDIYFYLTNERYAAREWPAVPQVGDYIQLRKDGSAEMTEAKVVKVLWLSSTPLRVKVFVDKPW